MALEEAGNSDAIAGLMIPLAGRGGGVDPSKTWAIAEAEAKTD